MTAATRAADRHARAAPVFAALGDPLRLQLVARLCRDGPQPIVRLADGTGVSRQAISKHLAALDAAGLVASERHGRERVWRLRPRRLDDVQRYLGRISSQWDSAIARLKASIERLPD
jgi:DNA-binding transcriptional ArsR family regulator